MQAPWRAGAAGHERPFCDRARVFLLAASLGESLVVLPLYTSHYKLSPAELARVGVEPGTVRVSLGLEHPADLITDLTHALRWSASPVSSGGREPPGR